MKYTPAPDGNGGLLELSGELCLETAGAVEAALSEAVSKGGDLTVSFEKVKTVDLCGLQLLFSALASIRAGGGRLLIPEKGRKALNNALDRAGCGRHRALFPAA